FIGCRRSDSNGTTGQLQAKRPRWHSCRVPICISLLVLYGIVFVLISQTASADNASQRATSAVDNQSHEHKQGERDDSCLNVSCPELVVEPPEAQKSGAETVVPLPEAQKSGAETVVPPPEAQKPGGESNVGAVGTTEMTTLRYALPQLALPADVGRKVGHKIWLNETGGNREAITSWNANEEFASLGIGHFIWFPAGKKAPFVESFPPMLEFLRQQNARLPSWVDQTPIPPCPWISRTDFIKNFRSPQMTQL